MRIVANRPARVTAGVFAGALIAMGALSPTANADDHSDRISETEYVALVDNYKAEHPNDFVGLDALVFEHTGKHIKVQVGKSDPLSAQAAQQKWNEAREKQLTEPLADYPSDSFNVAITALPTRENGLRYFGQWDWRDDFVGQGEPFDIANLQFDVPDCARLTDYNALAHAWDGGTPGDPPTLRDSGTGTGAPLWNVDARVTGFENTADNGWVAVTTDTMQCEEEPVSVGASFAYEGNIGGSLVGVSAGWGFLSITYSGGDLKLQKSTEPVYAEYKFSGAVVQTLELCEEIGRERVENGDYLDFQCRVYNPDSDTYKLWLASLV